MVKISSENLAIPLLKIYQSRDDFNEDEKYALMIIIVDSIEMYIEEYHTFPYLKDLESLLVNEYELHKQTIEYYACCEDILENSWYISPFMRLLIKK